MDHYNEWIINKRRKRKERKNGTSNKDYNDNENDVDQPDNIALTAQYPTQFLTQVIAIGFNTYYVFTNVSYLVNNNKPYQIL